tara:strand:+ start:4363 stop:4560 length:198 start_codon:yes stop_codon:yes gene_type:complete
MARIKRTVKTCEMTGRPYPVNEFYVNRNTEDGLHPYSKAADNFRRRLLGTGVGTMHLKQLFKTLR